MALSAKASVFTANTATGNQSVSGLGFTPKLVCFWGGNLTADGSGAGGNQFFGTAASSSQRFAVATAVDDGVGTSNTGIDYEQNACIVLLTDGTPTQDAKADFVSMDADGFTINWSDAPAAAVKVNYWAVGGADITNVEVGAWTGPTTTGLPKDHPKTGMSFQPDVVLMVPPRNRTAVGTATVASIDLSAFTKFGGSFQQGGMSAITNDAVSTAATKTYERTDKALVAVSTAIVLEAAAVSFNTDGWTLNFSTVATNSILIPYIAIKGGQWKAGSDTSPTSTGSSVKSGIGFTPKLLFTFGNYNAANSALATQSLNSSIGAASSATDARATGIGVSATGLVAKNQAANAKVISAITSTPATSVEAALTSLDSDGWTLNFGTVQGTAREYLWLTAGVASTPPGNVTPPAVTGAKFVGGTVNTDNGSWSPAATSYAYQWQRDTNGDLSFSNISLATSASYVLVGADQNCNVRCTVTATNSGGSTAQNSNTFGIIGPGYAEPVQDANVFICGNAASETFTPGANLPVNSVAPAVTGNKYNGQTLTTTNGTWSFAPSSFAYQWQFDTDSAFPTANPIGTNQNTYVLTGAEVSGYVRCEVTATNADGSGVADSNTVGLIGPSYVEPGQNALINIVSAHPQESYVDPNAPATGGLNTTIRADDTPVLAPFGI